MILGTMTKQPADRLDYDVEYDKWLPDGDALSLASATVDQPGLTIDSVQVIGTVVKVWLSGGDDGITYKVTVSVTTNDGRVKDDEFKIRVRDC